MRKIIGVGGAILLSLTTSTVPLESQGTSSFSRYDAPAINAPRTIVSADFNRDGFPDIALGGTGRASVGILLHHGLEDGDEGQRFGPLIEIVVGGGPFDMAAADLNRDGSPDLAVANADSNAITILLNNRSPIPFDSSFDIPVGHNPRGIAIGDFNRDAKPDIVVTRFTGTAAEIRYGAGDGTFPTGALVNVPEASQGVATGDFNADGWTDWVTVSYAGVAQFSYMNASGLSHQQQIPLGTNLNVVTTGDFDNNGWLDIAAASTSGSTVELVFRTANPDVFTTSSHPVASSPRGIEAADLNNDGWLDVVVAGRNTSSVSVLTRAADGSYTEAQYAAGIGARDVTLTDFDRNGAIDMLTANEYSNSSTLLANVTPRGTSGYAYEPLFLPHQFDSRVFGVADFNGNGKPDLVRRGNLFLDNATTSRQFLAPSPYDGAIADFNRDGRIDVVFSAPSDFSSSDRGLRMFFGNGSGDVVAGPTTWTFGGIADQLRTADLNRDGKLDLVLRMGGSTAAVRVEAWLGDGGGRFTRASAFEVDALWLEVGDVNRDGRHDAVVSTASGVHTLLGDGTGALRVAGTFGAGARWAGVALGDMTSDGILDLVIAENGMSPYGWPEVNGVVIARGIGDGTFAEFSRTATPNPEPWFGVPGALLLADLDHDGELDVLTGNGYFLKGAHGLLEPQLFAAKGSRMHAVDMNGDGLRDVVGVTHGTWDDPREMVMINTRRTPAENRAPVGVTLADTVRYAYAKAFYMEDEPEFSAGLRIHDPDLHLVRHRWTLADGRVVSTHPAGYAPGFDMTPGRYPMTFTVDDFRGGVTRKDFTLEMTPYKEAVITPQGSAILHGAWQMVADATANEGWRLWHPNVSAPKIQAPVAAPTDYVDIGFLADPTQEYKLWVRLKAEGDYWANDSVYIQFSGATDAAGNPVYRMGTNSALPINLEECSNCGIAGWGWEDDGWGAVNTNGVTLRFPEGGRQRLRIQAREDGVSIDTIVLSAQKYLTARPGTAKTDATKLPSTGPWMGTWWFD